MELLVFSMVFLPMISATAIYLYNRKFMGRVPIIMQMVLIALLAWITELYSLSGEYFRIIGGYLPHVGIGIRITSLEVVLLWLSVSVFTTVTVFGYRKRRDDYKYLFFLLMLQGTFNGLIIADDLYNIFIMMDIVTIISAVMIIYEKDSDSLRAGIYYLLFNTVGMLLYLVGVILLYNTYHTLNITQLITLINASPPAAVTKLGLSLLFVSFGVKSALFPVYDWLPRAHSSSPTEVSALLSGLLVKAGIVGIIKVILPVETFDFTGIMMVFGIVSAISGAFFALAHYNIKKVLSFHTISQIGLILLALSFDRDAGVIYLVSHGIFKMALFLGAGKAIEIFGTKDLREMRGLFRKNILTGFVMTYAILSIAGAPLTSGFIAKSVIKSGLKGPTGMAIYVVISALTALSFTKVAAILPGKGDGRGLRIRSEEIGMSISFILLIIAAFYRNYYQEMFSIDLLYHYKLSGILLSSGIILVSAYSFKTVKKLLNWPLARLKVFSIEYSNAVIILMAFFVTIYFVL